MRPRVGPAGDILVGSSGVAITQLSLALVDSQATNRALVTQLGEANATIAVLSLATHRVLHPDPIKVAVLFEKFAAAHGPRREGEKPQHKSWVTMRNRLVAFVEFYGDKNCDELRPSHWPPFRAHRLDQAIKGPTDPSKKKKMSPLTINHELGWVKRMFNWGADEEQNLVKGNPFAVVKRQKCRFKRETWITEADVQSMLTATWAALDHVFLFVRTFLIVMVDTGLRFNEARNLRRDRIRERADGRIMVDVGRTKNGKPHLMGLTARAFEALAEIEPAEGCPYFFAHYRRPRRGMAKEARLFSERAMRVWFRAMCVAAGVDSKVADGDLRLRPHDIRHSAATLAHRRGASLKAISRMLNHSDVSITVRYIHDDEDAAAEMAELMEDGIRKEAKPVTGRRKGAHRTAPPHVAPERRTSA